MSFFSSRERDLIDIARVLCIVSMMWVHVNPGLSQASFVRTGDGWIAGLLLGDILGRMSVTTLSFVSGYLFWMTSVDRGLGAVGGRLFQTILLPALVWNVILVLLAFARWGLLGVPSAALGFAGGGAAAWIDALTGVAGPTANLSLFFLRDLVVATLVLWVIRPLLRAYPRTVAAAGVALALGPSLAPFLFRTSILSFLLLGAAMAQCGLRLSDLSRTAPALGGAALLALVAAVASALEPAGEQVGALTNLLHRMSLGLLVLAVSARLAGASLGRRIVPLGERAYLAYLCHVPVIGGFWFVWVRFGGDAAGPAYLAFFVAAPFAAFALAVVLGRLLDAAPAPVQKLLRGKARDPGRAARRRSSAAN